MSINKHKNSDNEKQKVVSEYFTNNVMDESSDFHEKKDFVNLKSLPKSKATIKKKPVKKIKGQKDIRTALKSKKNELISYSKDFDKVCRKSGIDIDSEQLQLAIALSKSLNNPVNITNPCCSSESSNSKDNCNKIRTTLQEYGFTVPDIKIVKSQIKRPKKHRIPYKLLVTNEEEKKLIIQDRYTKIISETVDTALLPVEENQHCAESNLQYLATTASYETIKDIEIFYVKNLLQISPNSIGSLLKDWASIPGRTASPTFDCTGNFKFNEVSCTLSDLDTILSGTIETTQSIIRRITEGFVDTDLKTKEKTESVIMKGIDKADANNTMTNVNPERSCSPDIFDDDISIDKTSNNTFSEATVKESHFMDLTECVPLLKANTTANKTVLSQNNITKRKSNDFMEITNCIASSSQPIMVNNCLIINKDNNSEGKQNSIVINDRNNKVKTIDLTHHKETDKVDKQVSLDNVDLTQSSDSCELPAINLSNAQKDEETILLDESEYTVSNTPRKASIDNGTGSDNDLGPKDIVTLYSDVDDILDLTLEIQKSPSKENDIKLEAGTNQSLVSNTSLNKDEINNETEIDLTNEDFFNSDCKSAKVSYSSLGKSDTDNMSLDYDEVINVEYYETKTISQIEYNEDLDIHNAQPVSVNDNSKDQKENLIEEHSASSNKLDSSQASEVFEIYDNELDYSIQQSRLEMPSEHFEIGGLSILDNLSTHTSHMSKIETAESRTAAVDNKEEDTNDKLMKENVHKTFTPAKNDGEIKTAIQTPRTDYIIKTDQVTPMADYTSMDTPDRNKELDKYGLKPFKRKRAIQLLTHLYNQTHPLVENISQEDLPSPSKKLRREPFQNSQKDSPKKSLNSPNKKSHKVLEDKGHNCENLYKITNECPNIKDIVCDPDDYVFQKREKAKVHTCKVPLHIVFYNYVSCHSELKEAILRYEPVNIDDIHKDLVALGYRFDPKDLLKFLDKKCITVKTADNNSRNHRK